MLSFKVLRMVLAFVILTCFAAGARGQTTWYVDDDASPGGDGTTWSTAYHSLSTALTAAQPGDQIWVAAGTYVGSFTLALEVKLYGGFAGTETELTQRDWTANPTILDGNANFHVVSSPSGATATTRIDGFTITNGNAYFGGGLYLFDSSPTIANNTITGNIASVYGGGLYVSSSSPTIANNTITGNIARLDGGGLYMGHSSPTIADNTITGNIAVDDGGGLYVGYASFPTIANTIVAFNSSGVYRYSNGGVPTLRHNCVYGNTAYDYSGLTDPTGTDGNISADPLFAGPQYGNLHIQPDSPCVDAGTNAYAFGDLDMDGEPRIQPLGGTVDIGADESDGTVWPAGPYVIVRVSPVGDDANDGSSWALAKRTVQAGVAAASVLGGEVWVQAGAYYERVALPRYVYLYGGFAGGETMRNERDWVANVTALDGRQQGSVVTAQVGDGVRAIDGFTITNGSGTELLSYAYGGGVYLFWSSPTIANNTITGNNAFHGGGVYLSHSSPTIANNTITDNSARWGGGGLWLRYDSSPTIESNTITGNSARVNGGGLYLDGSSPTIANNTITGNDAEQAGGLFLSSSSPTIANTIVAFNSSGIHRDDTPDTPTLWYNCVYGNTAYDYSNLSDPTGTDGNISVDPLLANPQYGDLHIQPDSPCVDAGNNADVSGDFDMDGEPRIQPSGGAVDIGADESDGTVWPAGPYTIVRVSPVGDDANDGSSWSLAKRTVQAGIDAASALGGEVWVQAGTYDECITLHPYVYVYGGFAGEETMRDERDWVANVTTLDGQQQGSVVTVQGGKGISTIDGFTITNGDAYFGGGLYLLWSAPTITNNTITGNTGAWGGGLLLRESCPTITNNTITDNSAPFEGGGLYLAFSSPTIANNTIAGNSAYSRRGGGLRLRYSSPTIEGNTITGNSTATYGGGLCLFESDPKIVNNTITGNSADEDGGGLYLNWSSPTIANNTITGNIAEFDGGGLIIRTYSSVTIANSTIVGNIAGGDGGGLYLDYSYSSPTIANTIVAFNSSGIHRDDTSDTPTLGYNCVYGNTAYDYSGLTDPTGADGNISADPLFAQDPDPGPDGIWGTDDDDFGDLQLLYGSPCVDAADNDSVPPDTPDLDDDGDTAEPLPLDLAGGPRFLDDPHAPDTGNPGVTGFSVVDMGAYEFLSSCGNGVVDPVEECDDAGESAQCDTDCTVAECGDGTLNVTAGEECDDGNVDNTDACVDECVNAACSDGHVWLAVEECDDGNAIGGDGCSSNCVLEGACCRASGTCVVATEEVCVVAPGGAFQGDTTVCEPLEACCLPDNTCQDLEPTCCAKLGGDPKGPGTVCMGIAACHFPDQACVDIDRRCCLNQGGTPKPGEFCGGVAACCLPDDTCEEVDALVCVQKDGLPQGTGSVCEQLQACCLGNTCEDLEPNCCLKNGGSPTGAGTACSVPELCCLPDHTCKPMDPLCCTSQGGKLVTMCPCGACCLKDTDGQCVDYAIEEECPHADLKFFPGRGCDEISCDEITIPTVSQWGLIVLTVLLLSGIKVIFGRRPAQQA